MKNLWIFILVVLVAAGAFFLGRRDGESNAPTAAANAASTSVAATAASAAAAETDKQHPPSAPVQTYRGPDGRAHIISYDEKNPPNNSDPEQVSAALLSDMKYYPTNIQNSYGLSPADMKAMLAGSKKIPAFMLPEPGAPPSAK